jgi:outer membrane protein assembly factor BamB
MSNWWMFHGDPAHTGEVTGSTINSSNVSGLKLLHSIDVPGSILSTPAVADGFIYVGLANTLDVATQNGGTLLKIDLATGTQPVPPYNWSINPADRDTHGFCGMGCTPAVANGSVYFSAFDGTLRCLDQETLAEKWVTNLRYADMAHNQPVTNDFPNGNDVPPSLGGPLAKASGWSSPLVVNNRVYLGMGEGENAYLYSFVYCLDANSGDVIWIYCTCQFYVDGNNEPNQLPLETIRQELPPGFTTYPYQPVAKGASVWSGVAYDPDLDQLYCATGNPQPDGSLPTAGYSNGILILSGSTGEWKGFVQMPSSATNPDAQSYRPSDVDVDIGGAPTLWSLNGRKVVGIGCKNGCYMTFDANTFEPVASRQMLPFMNDGSQISTVDPHGNDAANDPNPVITNAMSNVTPGENFHGTYSTAALCSAQQKIFIGIGGNNYHFICAGIDSASTPFIRALDWTTLKDAWPLDNGDPRRYSAASDPNNPLYKPPVGGQVESGISVPAVVNDVVFMTTTRVAMYAFSATDGTLLWGDVANFGSQTGGFNGGYGYCMGPAIAGNYVVAGALVLGGNGGVLNIYALPS